VRIFHPDKNSAPEAEIVTKLLNGAKEKIDILLEFTEGTNYFQETSKTTMIIDNFLAVFCNGYNPDNYDDDVHENSNVINPSSVIDLTESSDHNDDHKTPKRPRENDDDDHDDHDDDDDDDHHHHFHAVF
jgi:hypothetical protein